MLNNITNFFNLIATKKIKTQLDPTDLLAIGTKDPRFTGNYQPTLIEYSNFVSGLVGGSNGQVLFNDNDTISGAANFYWDKVNNRISGGPTPTTSNFVIQKDITNDFIMYSPATYGGIQTIPTSGGANTVVNGKLSGTHGGYGNVAMGLGTVQADGSAFFGSTAIGQASFARGIYGLALGCEAKSGSAVTAPSAATAIGYNALATRNYSVALGYNSVAAIDNAIALGDLNSLVQIGGNFTPSARVHIKGFGTTSSTTSLLVQNSLSETLRIWDDGNIGINVAGTNSGFKLDVNGTARVQSTLTVSGNQILFSANPSNTYIIQQMGTGLALFSAAACMQIQVNTFPKIIVRDTGASRASTLIVGDNVSTSEAAHSSALLEVRSSDAYVRGFLPPRMTSAQRTAIATPATGLMVYQTDGTEGLYIYKSTGWVLNS